MKAIVTGATGFLGRNLVAQLKQQNWQVIALGRNQNIGEQLQNAAVEFRKIDLSDRQALENKFETVDVIFHCAAKSTLLGTYQDFYLNNVVATENILQMAENFKCKRIVHVSSASVYFNFQDRINVKETSVLPKKFVNHYAKTKFESEQVLLKANTDVERIVIRPRGIFGEYDTAIMPRILRIAKTGHMPLMNHGRALIDITYVNNVVAAMIAAATTTCINGEIFNISNDEPMAVKKILDMVFLNLDQTIKYKNIPLHIAQTWARILEIYANLNKNYEPKYTCYSLGLLANHFTLNIDKAKSLLNYHPIYNLQTGIERYGKWFHQQY